MNISEIYNHKMLLLSNLYTSKWIDALNLFLIVPMAVISLVFNLTSFSVFLNKSFRKISYFKYVLVYTANGFLISLGMIFFFYVSPNYLFELGLSYSARIFKCYLAPSYIIGLCFFYGNILDIVVNVEKILNFRNDKKQDTNFPYIICFVLFIICSIINLPNNFNLSLVENDQIFKKNKLCVRSEFSSTLYGKMFLIISYSLQGPVSLGVFLLTNVILIKTFRTYWKNKIELIQKSLTEIQTIKRNKMTQLYKKLILMTLALSCLSFLFHLIQMIFHLSLFFLYPKSKMNGLFFFLYALAIILKHFLNIFFFYFFNSRFRRNLFKKSIHKKVLTHLVAN